MKFIHEPDGADEPTIWALENGDTDQYQYTHLFSRVDLAPDARRFWPDVVARMTGTTITRDDLSALCLSYLKPPKYAGGSWTLNPDALADAILAALTGVPHDTDDTCVYCDCPTRNHDCTGCLTVGCPCGFDGDWHPEPPRGDE